MSKKKKAVIAAAAAVLVAVCAAVVAVIISGKNNTAAGNNGENYNFESAEIGSYVSFGAYEQDNNTENGKEKIEWLVLDKTDSRLLVISRYALEAQPYHTNPAEKNVTWETCSLRGWLNYGFIDEAFTDGEKAKICTTKVSGANNPHRGTSGGNSTEDKLFLLSMAEVEEKYFGSQALKACAPTACVAEKGCIVTDKGNGLWWLRTPGETNAHAAFVNDEGYVYGDGAAVGQVDYLVRPAMWIEF